jgi:hypothetical protein
LAIHLSHAPANVCDENRGVSTVLENLEHLDLFSSPILDGRSSQGCYLRQVSVLSMQAPLIKIRYC